MSGRVDPPRRGLVRTLLSGLVAVGFPSTCLICRVSLSSPLEGPICALCWLSMPVIREPYCPLCGLPFEATVAPGLCGPCRGEKGRGFRRARALGPYDGGLKETLLSLKFEGRARIATTLGKLAFRSILAAGELDAGAAVIPVPLHWRRRRERGYNQAELLAKAIAKAAERPCCSALVKVASRPPQAGLSAGARRRNAAGAYRARVPAWLRRKHLLLVDDVFTTGATAEACARALLRGGAQSVDVLTVARVP